MKRAPLIALLLTAICCPVLPTFAEDPEEAAPQPGDLEKVQIAESPALPGLTRIAISPDGKFVYASAFQARAIGVFSRDLKTGALTTVSTLTAPSLQGVMGLRLSPDGSYAIAAAPSVGSITAFKRDKETGALEVVAVAKQGENANDGLTMAADASFGADNQYIYTAAFTGVGVYKLENDRLTFVQFEKADGKLNFVRNLTTSADGNTIYALGFQSANLAVLRRNPADGKVEVAQVLSSTDEGCSSLKGAFRICCSPDGRHVYVSSGRFGGSAAVSAYACSPEGTLKPVEQHPEGETLEGFKGGNDIKTSPDGALVYAVASLSDRLFRFQRDNETGALIPIGSQPVGRLTNPGAAGLCFSPDNKFVYVADEGSRSIVVLKLP